MRFGIVHRVFLDALATMGVLALLATGEVDRRMSLALVVTLLVALVLPSSIRERRIVQFAGTAIPLCFLGIQVYRLASSTSMVSLAVEFAGVLQVVRIGTRKGAAHDQQIILLALLHLIAATVLGAGLAYAACFIGFMFIAPVTLLLSHLRREVEGNYRQGAKDRSGLPVDVPRILRSRRVVGAGYLAMVVSLSAPMFVFTGLLFAAFPRVGLSLLLLQPSRKARMVGFSDHIDLGVVGKLQSDPSVALRLTYSDMPKDPPERLAVYLRGTTLDRYDGRSWSKEKTPVQVAEHDDNLYPIRRWPDLNSDRFATVDLSPIDPPILFLPSDAVAVQLLQPVRADTQATVTLYRNADNEFRYVADPSLSVRYRIYLDPVGAECPPELTAADRTKYLSVPQRISPRVEALAREWVGSATSPLEQAQIIEGHLRRKYRYDMDSPSGAAENPIEDFLFNSRRGHCEYYATAMALLMRTLGVPSRDVTGFGAATYNRFGKFYVVRQSDAHSWVESWIDGIGWHRFDPTPNQPTNVTSDYGTLARTVRDLFDAAAQRWSRHVESYDFQQQLQIWDDIRSVTQRMRLEGHAREKKPWLAYAIVASSLLLGLRAWYLWRRRGKRHPLAATRNRDVSPPARAAIRLYQRLESAMASRGIARPNHLPPTAWANILVSSGHPLGDQVAKLTSIYVEARFGDRVLTPSEVHVFHVTVDQLKHAPLRPAA